MPNQISEQERSFSCPCWYCALSPDIAHLADRMALLKSTQLNQDTRTEHTPNQVGARGEIVFGLHFGLVPNLEAGGDGHVDYKVDTAADPLIVDVKTTTGQGWSKHFPSEKDWIQEAGRAYVLLRTQGRHVHFLGVAFGSAASKSDHLSWTPPAPVPDIDALTDLMYSNAGIRDEDVYVRSLSRYLFSIERRELRKTEYASFGHLFGPERRFHVGTLVEHPRHKLGVVTGVDKGPLYLHTLQRDSDELVRVSFADGVERVLAADLSELKEIQSWQSTRSRAADLLSAAEIRSRSIHCDLSLRLDDLDVLAPLDIVQRPSR